MSDASKAPGEPVEEPRPGDDVVEQANAALADAEAAQREIVETDVDAEEEARFAAYAASAAPADDVASDDVPTTAYAAAAPVTAAYDAPTAAYAPAAVTPSEPLLQAAPVAAPPQPIFVQAPEEPMPRGNRAAVGAIGLLAALCFAVLYLAAFLGLGLLEGSIATSGIADAAVTGLTSWWLWTATAIFFLGFWLFGAIVNRGRWGYWVIWGILLGFVGYGAHLVGQLFEAPFWQLTRSEGVALVEAQLYAPLGFVAFVIARELTVWFGAWAAARGKRITELNIEARREYERTLEAGPQVVRS